MRAQQRLPAQLRREGVLHRLAGERKGSGTPRKGSAREVQGTAGLLRQYSEQI